MCVCWWCWLLVFMELCSSVSEITAWVYTECGCACGSGETHNVWWWQVQVRIVLELWNCGKVGAYEKVVPALHFGQTLVWLGWGWAMQ